MVDLLRRKRTSGVHERGLTEIKTHECGSLITALREWATQMLVREWGHRKSTNGDFPRPSGRTQALFLRMEEQCQDVRNLRVEISHDGLLRMEKSRKSANGDFQQLFREWGHRKSTNGDFPRPSGRKQKLFLRLEERDAKNLRVEISHGGLLRMEKSTNCNRRDCHTRPIEQTTKW